MAVVCQPLPVQRASQQQPRHRSVIRRRGGLCTQHTAVHKFTCPERAPPVIASNVAVIAVECYWKVALGEKHRISVAIV